LTGRERKWNISPWLMTVSPQIDDDLVADVKVAAAARGIPVEMFVRDALESHIAAEYEWSDDPDPAIDMRIAEEAIRTGDTLDWVDARGLDRVLGQAWRTTAAQMAKSG
jgi:hypothetical protein